MSLIIPGEKMPKKCYDCPCFDDVYIDAYGDYEYRCNLGLSLDYWKASGEEDKDCPLIEVLAPHGRLIDADALKRNITANLPVAFQEFSVVLCNIIDMQKAVIGSELEG